MPKALRGVIAVLSLLAAALLVGQAVPALAEGEGPAHITYGYHPYWTGGWTGVVIKQRELWKKYLPAGSTVRFEAHLTGPPMVNAMLADKMQIGCMGDMPSLVATTKKAQGDIRLVAANMISLGQNCNLLVVRKDAPDFKSPQEALQWLNGKIVAAHRGTCSNRFIDSILDKNGIKPKERLNMTIEVIASSFEAGKIDAAPMWEPHAQKVVDQGYGKYVATGAPWGEWDANFTIMRQDFIQAHPEAAKGWIKAEIEALQIMQKEPEAVAEMVLKETQGYTEKTLWKALYEKMPAGIGGEQVKYIGEMSFTPRVLDIMRVGYEFLHKLKVIDSGEMTKDAINEGPVKAALAEMGLSAPVAEIQARPMSAYTGK